VSDRVARVERARQLASQLDPAWGAREVEAALRGLPRRRRRRVALRASGLVLAGALATAAIAVGVSMGGADPSAGPSPARPAPDLLRLADGSTAVALAEGTEVVPLEIDRGRVVVELVRGAAMFSVAPSHDRSFHVRAGAVEVVALGTEFSVERGTVGVEVAVQRGRVRVEGESAAVELAAGQRRRFESGRSAAAPAAVPAPPPQRATAPRVPPPSRRAEGRSPPSWRALAASGEYDEAYRRYDPTEVRDDVEDLLLAADVARLSGHPSGAVAPLRRVVDGHAADPRRQIAAFTLGRVLLDELGDPRAAAAAFASARSLAPAGPLAEDALAREVEAWSRAGEGQRAAVAAGAYLERYPDGRRLKAVRRFGGLD